jgi:hypothetical protein
MGKRGGLAIRGGPPRRFEATPRNHADTVSAVARLVVEKLGVYWYPVGGRGGWPKTPYNYMGFRYHGQLQSVHHVDDSVVVSDLSEAVKEVSSPSHGPVFVLKLGPAIPVPPGIRTGKKIVRSARRTIDIDLLLTSSTISEAWEKMAARHADDG